MPLPLPHANHLACCSGAGAPSWLTLNRKCVPCFRDRAITPSNPYFNIPNKLTLSSLLCHLCTCPFIYMYILCVYIIRFMPSAIWVHVYVYMHAYSQNTLHIASSYRQTWECLSIRSSFFSRGARIPTAKSYGTEGREFNFHSHQTNDFQIWYLELLWLDWSGLV